jgi:hypothetical protein
LELIAYISASVRHCLAFAKSLLDHSHDRSHIVKSAAMSVIAGRREVGQVEYQYLVAFQFASVRLLGGVDITQAGRVIRYGSG